MRKNTLFLMLLGIVFQAYIANAEDSPPRISPVTLKLECTVGNTTTGSSAVWYDEDINLTIPLMTCNQNGARIYKPSCEKEFVEYGSFGQRTGEKKDPLKSFNLSLSAKFSKVSRAPFYSSDLTLSFYSPSNGGFSIVELDSFIQASRSKTLWHWRDMDDGLSLIYCLVELRDSSSPPKKVP